MRKMPTEIVYRDTVKVYFSDTACETYEFNEWKAPGKHRAYVRTAGKASKQYQHGYIDMITGEFVGKNPSDILLNAIEAYKAYAADNA